LEISFVAQDWNGLGTCVEGCLIRIVLDGHLRGKIPVGRPRQRWFDTAKRDLTRVDTIYSINLAVDRMQWRGILEAALDLNGLFQAQEEGSLIYATTRSVAVLVLV
jgi:hypothetical protein